MTAKKGSYLWRNFFFSGITIFGVEILVMMILSLSGLSTQLPMVHEAVLDSFLLLILIFPVFHLLLFRPMRSQIAALREAKLESGRKNKELALLMERNAMILAAAQEGILGLDRKGKTIFVNPAAEKMLGWPKDALIGAKQGDPISHAVFVKLSPGQTCPVHNCLSSGESVRQIEIRFQRRDSTMFPAEINCAPMKDEEGIIGAVLTFRDITERKKTEERLKNLAYFDALTELPNRPLLQDRFKHLAVQAQREGKIPAVMLFDLDDFKQINDLHGHAAGDAFLQEIAGRLRNAVRKTDTVARLGGDEFVWAGLVGGTKEAVSVAKKILAAIAKPVVVEGLTLAGSASIGIALQQGHEEGFESILKAADAAMYRAKGQGKNAFFFPGHSEKIPQPSPSGEVGLPR